MDEKTWSKEIVPVSGPDVLRKQTLGSEMDVVQLKPGKLRGFIKYFQIGNLEISLGRFNLATRMRGVVHKDKFVLSTILQGRSRITESWKEALPSNVGIFPTGVDLDAIFGGGISYLIVSIPLTELSSRLGGEEHLAQLALSAKKCVFNIDPHIGAEVLQRLVGIVSGIESKLTAPSYQASNFLQRSIIEPFVLGVTSTLPPTSVQTGARLVSEAEDYIDAADGRPVHISELCTALNVSRRSLHRAFADGLGIGPAAYLRSRRLSAIRSVLTRSDPAAISIGDLAFEYGFPETGRFASRYRAHFGETPSETLRSRRVGTRIAA